MVDKLKLWDIAATIRAPATSQPDETYGPMASLGVGETSAYVTASSVDLANGLATLLAAAPQLARALAMVECAGAEGWDGPGFCPSCGADVAGEPHRCDCILDAALTAAGLGPEDRARVRRGET